jgi:hypothetical protein
MPPRPAPPSTSAKSKHTNRISAVYIGPNPISNSYHPSSSPPSHLSARSPPTSHPDIPDLPEPPSPGGSSTGSGLPSPPATNSTGSGNGSTGDPNSIAIRGRERPVSLNNSSSGGSAGGSSVGGVAFHRKNGSVGSIASTSTATARLGEHGPLGDHGDVDNDDYDHSGSGSGSHNDDDDERGVMQRGNHNEDELEDGDDTARLDRRQSLNENVLALQRVRSLTERNRMVLHFLTSCWKFWC